MKNKECNLFEVWKIQNSLLEAIRRWHTRPITRRFPAIRYAAPGPLESRTIHAIIFVCAANLKGMRIVRAGFFNSDEYLPTGDDDHWDRIACQ